MMSWLRQAERQSPAVFVTVSILIVMVVGIVDYATSQEVSFSIFYLFALGLAAWFVRRSFAFFIAFFSVVVSLLGDYASGARYPSGFVPFWNAFIALAFYVVVAILLARLRLLTRGLESQVQERTMALTRQMGERERLERELLDISEREQRRIGHDLHDSLCQHLTGAALAARVLEEKLAAKSSPEAADAQNVVELVEEGIALTRKLAHGLHPIEMSGDGLMQALEELASTSAELFKLDCGFECDSPVLVKDPTCSIHLYRIAQEAVSNAVKHGKPKHVVIKLEALESGICLEIRDDGSGFFHEPPKMNGMGLRIMEHRSEMIGGTFSVGRGESTGTVVSCLLKLPDEREKSVT